MHAEELCEVLAILVGIRGLGVLLNLLAVPEQVAHDYDSAHDTADDTPFDTVGPSDACSVGCDNDGERVDRGERGTHGAGEEDSADADDGVITQGEEYRHENRIERDRFLFEAASRTAENHQDADEEHQGEFATFCLLRQCDKARFERARCVDDAD